MCKHQGSCRTLMFSWKRMKSKNKKILILTAVGISALFFISAAVFILAPRGKPLPALETDALYSIVEDGDIICRLGDRLWSQFFKDMSETDKRYSHIGIVRIKDGIITVIHSEGDSGHGRDYVNEIAFEEFISIARAVGIYRIKDEIKEKYTIAASQLSNLAAEYLGTPFDWQFDMTDESKIYCTELLSVILKRIAPELELTSAYVKEWGRYVIPLDAISTSEYFSEVYYIWEMSREQVAGSR